MNNPATLLTTLATVSLLFATTAATATAATGATTAPEAIPATVAFPSTTTPDAPVAAPAAATAAPTPVAAVDHEAPAPAAVVAVDDEVPGARRAVAAHHEVPTVSAAPAPARAFALPLEIRLEGSMVAMRDSWLGIPAPELGLTVGADLTRSWSLELTGSARDPESDTRRAWSALAAARWVAVASANGRHRLTVAGGPFVEVNNVVHGTIPFAHGELAYVYRAPFGLTVLAGFGPNIALANSSYVAPPRTPCNDSGGDAIVFCLDLGPDAQELHVGDAVGQMRLAVGWQF